MRDFVGTQLDVGDKVVYSRMIGNKLEMIDTVVLGFTDSKVKIEPVSCSDDKRGYALCTPEKLVVYDYVQEDV
jgi:hypothetical protein